MMPIPAKRGRNRGFTLIEVMLSLVVTAIGLIGLAKMQAVAIASTREAGNQSLVAAQTGSLAAMMRANRGFWSKGDAPISLSMQGAVVTDGRHVLDTAVPAAGCTVYCTPTQLAAADVQEWTRDMFSHFPNYQATVDCTDKTVPPVSCSIYVTWTETLIATNQSAQTGAANQVAVKSFSVFVEP